MNRTQSIEEAYFEWLYGLVASTTNRNPARSYWALLRQLHSKAFEWSVPNDDNRIVDGKELRDEFLEKFSLDWVDETWMSLDCSFLEMLIGLARRLSFESDGTASVWFWKLLTNLKIRDYTDSVYTSMVGFDIEGVMDRVIRRTYFKDGEGGLFPLQEADRDQRKVEIWYQMSAYLLEGG